MGDQDPYGAIKFGEFRKYMQNKQSKLKEQESILGNQGDSNNIPILQGLSIYVNGYTDPPQSELRRLILQYGGDYQHYLKKSKVTHIIATTLTNSKMEEFRAYKVVTPDFITDSIQQGQLLPWANYRVIQNQSAQKQLPFGPSSHQTVPTAAMSNPQQQTTSLSTRTESSALKPLLPPPQLQRSISSPPQSRSTNNNIPKPWSPRHKNGQEKQQQLPSGEELNAALLANPWNRSNSSTNPDFIKKYYKSSRLHHLSSWKAELRDIVRKAKAQQTQGSTRMKSNPPKGGDRHRLVMHVDFDCFFASVGIKSRPELAKLPVAVSHGKGLVKNSSSDIASCNYVARSFGVRNGMRVGRARELCPDLQIIPYEFEKYREVSETFYSILFQYADEIQAVSVDEALLEVGFHITMPGTNQEDALALMIRNEIREKTGCEASIGMGANILLARLATKKAKPCNHYYCTPQDVTTFLSEQKVEDLPGVGYAMTSKLQELGVATVGQLGQISKTTLMSKFGPKTGQTLYDFARGVDDRRLDTKQARQSVSAEVNWGVRFENKEQIETFLDSLSSEISERLDAIGRKGRSITLKVLVRAKHATEAEKHLGCGECDSYSKSVVLDYFTDDCDIIAKHVKRALKSFTFSAADIRGLSIQIQKLNHEADEVDDIEGDQQKLNFGAVAETVKSALSKNKMVIERKVYMELPQDIQNELKDEYDLEIALDTQQKEDGPAEQHDTQDICDQHITHSVADTDGILSQFLPVLPNWSQLDPSALLALPPTMQKQVLEAYKSSDTSKHNYVDDTITSRSRPISMKSPSRHTPTSSEHGKVTKSPQSRRTKTRLNNKKSLNVITLTQMFPPSPNRTIHQNSDGDDDLFPSNDPDAPLVAAAATNNNVFDRDGVAPPVGDLDYSKFTSLNGKNPKTMEMWPQLPRDIQQELLDIYRQEQRQQRIQNRLVTEIQKPAQVEPMLMGKTSLTDVRTLLGAWVHEFSSGPDEKDVQTVANYLKDLIYSKELEKVQLLLMHLDHITQADRVNKAAWTSPIQDMKRMVSHEMVSAYGAPLG